MLSLIMVAITAPVFAEQFATITSCGVGISTEAAKFECIAGQYETPRRLTVLGQPLCELETGAPQEIHEEVDSLEGTRLKTLTCSGSQEGKFVLFDKAVVSYSAFPLVDVSTSNTVKALKSLVRKTARFQEVLRIDGIGSRLETASWTVNEIKTRRKPIYTVVVNDDFGDDFFFIVKGGVAIPVGKGIGLAYVPEAAFEVNGLVVIRIVACVSETENCSEEFLEAPKFISHFFND